MTSADQKIGFGLMSAIEIYARRMNLDMGTAWLHFHKGVFAVELLCDDGRVLSFPKRGETVVIKNRD